MGVRVKKYLLFMFGHWKSMEENQVIVNNIREVMDTIIVGDEFSFVTGDNVIIMCLKSKLPFEEIDSLLKEFLTDKVTAFFLMAKPRKLGFRLEDNLQNHLFGLNPYPPQKQMNPTVAAEISRQLKAIMEHRMKNIREILEKPIETKKTLRKPFSLDVLLDKILDEGMDSLTKQELEYLNKYKK
tara:strand:+ start:269 stop:820 length:552 start_codon:yes stop_codon:yes gene_type:complete